jgi:hypothetical protein
MDKIGALACVSSPVFWIVYAWTNYDVFMTLLFAKTGLLEYWYIILLHVIFSWFVKLR